MRELRITFEELKDLKLTLVQYIYLWSLYNCFVIKDFSIKDSSIKELVKREYIALGKDHNLLTTKGNDLFETKVDLFDEFIKVFPTRVTDNTGKSRVLSPASSNTNVGKKLKHKWFNVTNNDINKQEHIIKCLKLEVDLKRRENNLFWMRNAETWLNKCTWEDYEYLLDEPKKENVSSTSSVLKL